MCACSAPADRPSRCGPCGLPVHDAIVFECRLPDLQEVGELTQNTLCEVVQECFPQLRPKAEINIDHPQCWNKDGQTEAFKQWLMKTGDALKEKKPTMQLEESEREKAL